MTALPIAAPNEVLNAVPYSVIATDLAGRITSWNRAAEELFGYTAAEAVGQCIVELLPPVSLRRDAMEIARGISAGDERVGTEILRGAHGREVAIHYETRALHDADGRVIGTVGVACAPHNAHQAERLIRRNMELHRVMFQASPSPKLLIDRETLRFLDVNDAAVSTYGYSQAEFMDMTLDQLHVGDVAALRDRLTDAAEGQKPLRATTHRAKDGRELEVAITRRDVDYAGRRARLASIVDMTEQRAAERELRRSEALFRTLAENAFEIMTVFTLDGRFTMTSSVRALGYVQDDVVGRSLSDFVHPEDLPTLEASVAEVASVPGARKQAEVRCRDSEGRWRVLEGMLLNFLDNPAIGGIVSLCHDVTDQRETERALRESELQLQHIQKLEAVGRLAGGVAHDFNNLLTAIRGYTELVRMMLPAEHEAQPEIGEVLSAVDRAAALTRQLLAYSRRQLLQPTTLCPARVVRGVESMLRRLLYENIELEVVVEGDVPLIVADESQLQQVVLNLVVNARDAMPNGGVLSIHVYRAMLSATDAKRLGGSIAGPFAGIAVADNGTGMPPDVREHIFEPFFTTKPIGDGTGLGLSTVYGIVQQSGGYIDVHSTVGRGTRFELYFPAAPAGAHETDTRGLVTTGPAGGSESVLLVEDSASVRAIARRALQSAGYRVIDARDGLEALQVATGISAQIDIVVTDLVMPRLGGIELVHRLRARGFSGAMLAMTGYSDRLLAGGGEDPDLALHTIEKPFTMSALVARVRAAIDEHVARQRHEHESQERVA
ncbi:MAG TPA: PAS domain S-box protein [Gemmatimonadaceae bacterium]|nr:PAS domain S-box protein [Gemmatimonadaceae bacterium]